MTTHAAHDDPQREPRLQTSEEDPPPIWEQVSEECKKQREELLSKLQVEPPSIQVQACFESWREGSLKWNIDTFIEATKQFATLANLNESERVEYYGHPLLGLHYPHSFRALWNRTYPQQPISVFDVDFKRQSPPGWSNELRNGRSVLSYSGDAALSEGLNILFRGPTVLDCGKFCQLILWFAIRSLLGDAHFFRVFRFEKGEFTLTETWDKPMDALKSDGNLLYPFYDTPLFGKTKDSSQQESRIQTRSVFNHRDYLLKHPGGIARLQNVTQVDEQYIIFDPKSPKAILSPAELDQRLMQSYNLSRNSADLETLWIWECLPDFIHPDFAPKNFAHLREETKPYVRHTLNLTRWKASQADRESRARDFHLVFNFPKLISYINTEGREALTVMSRRQHLAALPRLEMQDTRKHWKAWRLFRGF